MFVPEAQLVPHEYWQHRGLVLALGLVSTAKAALTAQAHMIAIGVGDPDATPLSYIFISETNAAIGRFVGLALSPVRHLSRHPLLGTHDISAWEGGVGDLCPQLLWLLVAPVSLTGRLRGAICICQWAHAARLVVVLRNAQQADVGAERHPGQSRRYIPVRNACIGLLIG